VNPDANDNGDRRVLAICLVDDVLTAFLRRFKTRLAGEPFYFYSIYFREPLARL